MAETKKDVAAKEQERNALLEEKSNFQEIIRTQEANAVRALSLFGRLLLLLLVLICCVETDRRQIDVEKLQKEKNALEDALKTASAHRVSSLPLLLLSLLLSLTAAGSCRKEFLGFGTLSREAAGGGALLLLPLYFLRSSSSLTASLCSPRLSVSHSFQLEAHIKLYNKIAQDLVLSLLSN
jgi:hypothetical protein